MTNHSVKIRFQIQVLGKLMASYVISGWLVADWLAQIWLWHFQDFANWVFHTCLTCLTSGNLNCLISSLVVRSSGRCGLGLSPSLANVMEVGWRVGVSALPQVSLDGRGHGRSTENARTRKLKCWGTACQRTGHVILWSRSHMTHCHFQSKAQTKTILK